MTLTLSIASLRMHNACDLDKRIADLSRVLPDVSEDDPVPLATWWALPTTSAEDRWWSLRAVEPALEGRRLGVRAVCLAARRALPLTREPDRAVCLAAIEAAEAWAADPTPERAAHAAATAAAAVAAAVAAAADAAHAAAAAAYAAYAAAYAAADADAAAYVAYAAAYAAAAADAAAYAAAYAAYAVDAAAAARYAAHATAATSYASALEATRYAVKAAGPSETEAQRADLDRLLAEAEG